MNRTAQDAIDQMSGAAGIILFGGESRRMGRPKWSLPFGDEIMLGRMIRIVGQTAETIILVGAAEGELPESSLFSSGGAAQIILARDRQAGRGPLEGLAVGLDRAGHEGAGRAFVTTCDAPLLRPEFVRCMLELAIGHEAAVPRVNDRDYPLTAVYSTGLAPRIEALLAAGQRRAAAVAESAHTRWVTAADLKIVDPRLGSLRNINTPQEYATALSEGGFPPP